MFDFYKQYYDWIDWSVYEGLSVDESDTLEEEHELKYGVSHVLRSDAPPEAVEAWKKDCELSKEARETGLIID